MDVKEIKKLVDLMIRNDLRELEIQDGDSRVSLKRGPGETSAAVSLVPGVAGPLVLQTPTGQPMGEQAPSDKGQGTAQEQESEAVVSPMVGTFYQAPNPESPPFVQVGETVTEDTVVCIIEAMKVMNEIKAGINGVIEKVLITNGQAVQFGQKMFLVRPA